MRAILFFLPLVINLFAGEFDFKESRYYDALDFTRVSTGTISYDANSTTISYKSPIKERVVIQQDRAYVVKNSKSTPIDNQDALLFLRLFEKLIRDENLDRFFQKQGDILLPKQKLLSSTIKSVKKESDRIEIYLKNSDRVVLEKL